MAKRIVYPEISEGLFARSLPAGWASAIVARHEGLSMLLAAHVYL